MLIVSPFLMAQVSKLDKEYYEMFSELLDESGTEVKKVECPENSYNFKEITLVSWPNGNDKKIELSCDDVLPLGDLLKKVDSVYSSKFKVNSSKGNLKIALLEKLDNAFYADQYLALIIPKFLVLNKPYRNPDLLYPAIIHEYGHYICTQNYSIFQNYAKAKFIVNAAGELLADIFSVLYYNDGKIIMKSMKDTSLLQNKDFNNMKAFSARDFTNHENQLSSIMPILNNGKRAVIDNFVFDDHNYFSPMRYYLWNEYLGNPLITKKFSKATIAKHLSDRIVEFLSKKENDTCEFYTKSTEKKCVSIFEKNNRDLMEYLEKNPLR